MQKQLYNNLSLTQHYNTSRKSRTIHFHIACVVSSADYLFNEFLFLVWWIQSLVVVVSVVHGSKLANRSTCVNYSTNSVDSCVRNIVCPKLNV